MLQDQISAADTQQKPNILSSYHMSLINSFTKYCKHFAKICWQLYLAVSSQAQYPSTQAARSWLISISVKAQLWKDISSWILNNDCFSTLTAFLNSLELRTQVGKRFVKLSLLPHQATNNKRPRDTQSHRRFWGWTIKTSAKIKIAKFFSINGGFPLSFRRHG